MEFTRWQLIIAAVVIFIAWGYITDLFPRLIYVPWAFLSGCTSVLILAVRFILTTSKGVYEIGSLNGNRTRNGVAFSRRDAWQSEKEALKRGLQYRKTPVYPQSKEISKSADALLDLVIRDFITSWHQHISRQPYFQNEVDKAIRVVLSDILSRVVELDVLEILVSRFIPLITKHLRHFDDAERAVRGRKLSRNFTESEELNLAIAAKYDGGRLHPAAALVHSNLKLVQQQYLRGVVTRLVPKVMPAQMIKSAAVTVLVREVVACAVLYPMLDMLTDPDFWYQRVESYGRSLLQERKTVRKLRAALEEHTPDTTQPRSAVQLPKVEVGDSERKFERFVRAIRKVNTLSDARRFRSEVATQLRRDADVEGQDSLYLRRLEAGKRLLDQRIATMATAGSAKARQGGSTTPGVDGASEWETASLRMVLYNATGLSCFMEYMDRQHLMRLVQFWVVVDGVRNPLDDDDVGADLTSGWTQSDRDDLAQINEAYLSLPEIRATDETTGAVRSFLKAGGRATGEQYHAARRAVLQTQTAVYETMREQHYQNFRRSDLYYKWLASDETAASRVAIPSNEGSNSSAVDSSRPPRKQLRPSHHARLSSTGKASKPTDLRRAVASSSDLKAFVRTSGTDSPPRRSLDEPSSRAPLFDDNDNDSSDPLSRSTQSLDFDPGPPRSLEGNTRVVNAMQAALTDIMVEQPADGESLFTDPSVQSPQDAESMSGSMEIQRTASPAPGAQRVKPDLASLGLVGAPGTRGFLEESLFGEEEKFLEDGKGRSDGNENSDEDAIVEAAPGDLGLAEAIDALTLEIEKLVGQEAIVDSLTNKAELTNNAAELRILKKSKASLQREINRKELQRQQYIVQESNNSLYGRAEISIQSIMVGQEEDGKEFAMYVIEVRRQAGDQMSAATWVVARRYSEFYELNKRLRARYPIIRNLEFPHRQVVLKLQKDFLQKRRSALERYTRELLRVPAICRSRELRAFLSQEAISPVNADAQAQVDTRDLVTRIYNSVTDGMEEFLGNIPVLDQLSLAGQNLISAATTQMQNAPAGMATPPQPLTASAAGPATSLPVGELTTAAEAEAELRAFESKELEPFVKPIADLFLEAFELNRENNWLRGRAVVLVLHQLLGGTIERRVRDLGQQHLSDDSITKYLDLARETMWPGGQLRPSPAERTLQDKAKTRKEAGLALATLVPEVVGSVVGRNNASSASRRISAVLGNKRLNAHLVFTLLDEIIEVVFEERRP